MKCIPPSRHIANSKRVRLCEVG